MRDRVRPMRMLLTSAGLANGSMRSALQPHWHSAFMPERDDPWAERISGAAGFPVYVLDDDSAVRVRGDGAPGVDPVVDVVSEGRWRLVGS